MKKKLVLVIIQIVISLHLFSQDYYPQGYYLYVSTSNERLKPSLQRDGTSNDETLNRIFREFGVRRYRQSFPGAKNKELLNFYEIHLTESDSRSMDTFESVLRSQKTFDAIYRCDLL